MTTFTTPKHQNEDEDGDGDAVLRPHLTSDVSFQKKIYTINQGVHQKLQSPELCLVKTRKKSHDWIRRYCRLDFTTVFTK